MATVCALLILQLSRFLNVYCITLIVDRLYPGRMNRRYMILTWFSGLRGAMSKAKFKQPLHSGSSP